AAAGDECDTGGVVHFELLLGSHVTGAPSVAAKRLCISNQRIRLPVDAVVGLHRSRDRVGDRGGEPHVGGGGGEDPISSIERAGVEDFDQHLGVVAAE